MGAIPFPPMRAVAGDLPSDAGWGFELKWDGMRVVADWSGDRVRLWSANGIEATVTYPEVSGAIGAVLPTTRTVLDGEVVAFDGDGRPSFPRLQHRMGIRDHREAARRAMEVPVAFVVFDILVAAGREVTALPYAERRLLLTGMVPNGPHWQVPPHRDSGGSDLLDAARLGGLEGVVAKRLDSPYLPGRRSPTWRKVKVRLQEEFVVIGVVPGSGRRSGGIGSLALATRVFPGGPLTWAGNVGTGFTDAELERLDRVTATLLTTDPPVEVPAPPPAGLRGVRWLVPELVAQVAYAEWTPDGRLRHPTYLGLRGDKHHSEVVRESDGAFGP